MEPVADRDTGTNYVYLISCHGWGRTHVKIGLTSHLKRRISNIQTGCPFPISHIFAVPSEYREEARGLEKLLHMLLKPQRLRAEWYEGTDQFFAMLNSVLSRINAGGFTYDEILETPDVVGPELEIMMHRHQFSFYELAKPLRGQADPLASSVPTPPSCIASTLRKRAG